MKAKVYEFIGDDGEKKGTYVLPIVETCYTMDIMGNEEPREDDYYDFVDNTLEEKEIGKYITKLNKMGHKNITVKITELIEKEEEH